MDANQTESSTESSYRNKHGWRGDGLNDVY